MFSVETEDHHRNGFLGAIQRKLSKNSKILNDSNESKPDQISFGNFDLALAKSGSDRLENAVKRSCSICSPESNYANNTCTQQKEDDDVDNSMALVPVQQPEAASSSISLLIKELPEPRPGWPLLRRAIVSNRKALVRKISVVEWAMRLPNRRILQITNSDEKESGGDCEDRSCELDGESGAIVIVGNETGSVCFSPSYSSTSLPKELDGLHEKYAATCRLFKYQELLSATSNFKPGLFPPQEFVVCVIKKKLKNVRKEQ